MTPLMRHTGEASAGPPVENFTTLLWRGKSYGISTSLSRMFMSNFVAKKPRFGCLELPGGAYSCLFKWENDLLLVSARR